MEEGGTVDIFDSDSSTRSDIEDVVDNINRYMSENGIPLNNSTNSTEETPILNDSSTGEGIVE
jgi:hypothetical protein